MNSSKSGVSQRWSSNLAFILTAAGTAVGLGNIWRFTFIAGENGGGLFLFIYILTVILIGLPIMIAELLAGRRGRGGPVRSVAALIEDYGASRGWFAIGVLSVFIPFIGIAYYSIVSGWILDYLFRYLALGGLNGGGEAMSRHFDALMASPVRLQFWHFAFMSTVAFIVGRGIHAGVERTAKIFMPLLFLMLIGLVGYAAVYGEFQRGIEFLFKPDFSKLSVELVLLAVGQAFFSLAIGIGALMTFGSYLDENASLTRTAAVVVLADTLVAILAGLAIFPLVFVNGLDVNQGPGLIFVTLPTAFENMQGGGVLGLGFFLLLFFAALTTGIGTMEPVVAWMVGRGVSRARAAIYVGLSAWAIGAVIALSFNVLSDFRPVTFLSILREKSLFDFVDFTIASVLLPLNGLLLVLLVGWVVPKKVSAEELRTAPVLHRAWLFLVRFLAPVAIMSILASVFLSF